MLTVSVITSIVAAVAAELKVREIHLPKAASVW